MGSKKLWITVVVLLGILMLSLPKISLYLARISFSPNYQRRQWAPDLAIQSAKICFFYGQYEDTIRIATKIRETWPPHTSYAARALYLIGRSEDKKGNYENAIRIYNQFLKDYPQHELRETVEYYRRICEANTN